MLLKESDRLWLRNMALIRSSLGIFMKNLSLSSACILCVAVSVSIVLDVGFFTIQVEKYNSKNKVELVCLIYHITMEMIYNKGHFYFLIN
jgi:hypothetical protein